MKEDDTTRMASWVCSALLVAVLSTAAAYVVVLCLGILWLGGLVLGG